MKFLVFDNQPGLGTTRELILNWDNVKSIKPISTNTFSIILNNRASLMFKMEVGTAKDVIDVINRLLTTSRGKILKVKPATVGGFKFDNIAYIANSTTPSHIGQSDNMFGTTDNPINNVATGVLQLAKNPTQLNSPAFSSNSTIKAFQIVKVDDDIVTYSPYDIYPDFQMGYSGPGDELRIYNQGPWRIQFRANFGQAARDWIQQINDLIVAGKDQFTISMEVNGVQETHTLARGIWTLEYYNGYDNLRISTDAANWPFTGTSTAGINYGTNPVSLFEIEEYSKRQVYYYPNAEFYTPNILPEYIAENNWKYNGGIGSGGPEQFTTNPTIFTNIYTDSSNTNPNTEFNYLMDWFMWDDTLKRWGPYEDLPDAFNPNLQTDGVVQFVKNKNYATLLLGHSDYNPYITSYYTQHPGNPNGFKYTTLHGTSYVGDEYDEDTGEFYWPENYSPNVFEISNTFRFIDIRQPGNYGTNYGTPTGTGSSKTWPYQNYGAIRLRGLKQYDDNAAAVADNFPTEGIYMASGNGTIPKGTLMRCY